MSFADLAHRFESLTTTVSIGGRTLLGLDTNPVPSEWTHITKVDPESDKQLPLCFPLYLSHTSAVSVGGSRDVTDTNTEETFELVTATDVPAVHEPSAARHVTEDTRDHARFLAVPEVLNGDGESLVGTLGEGIEYVREDLGPRMIEEKLGISPNGIIGDRLGKFAAALLLHNESVFEAYIIMNTDSAAAREANVTEEDLLSPQEAKQRAMAAEYHLESEIIYLEYSGTYGGSEATEILDAIDGSVSWSRLWYGGGIDSREKATSVLDAGADAVVVGDVFHDIAAEEADLFERAREHFEYTTDDPVETDDLHEWVKETIDISETSAACYLSTIPSVSDPEARAARYLGAGVKMALEIQALADSMADPDPAAIRETLRAETVPGESAFADELDSRSKTIARQLSMSVLADHFDHDLEESFSARHLAAEL